MAIHGSPTRLGRLKVVPLGGFSAPDLARDALAGLSSMPKRLPPVHFYDAEGSRLFERITRLPEYYLTRTEESILRRHAGEIAAGAGAPLTLVELGSGSSRKTRTLISAILRRQPSLHYVALDVSADAVADAARALLRDYPGLRVTACVGDYHAGLSWLARRRLGRTLGLFLGSSIGNLDPTQARRLLREAAGALDALVLGADLEKDPSVLEPAYNDAAGVTARFNLNLLRRINRELDGHFDLGAFRHVAFYRRDEARMEMHLESLRDQEVAVEALGRAFRFHRGERLHTEDSRKYTIERLDALASEAALRRQRAWIDENGWYAVLMMRPA